MEKDQLTKVKRVPKRGHYDKETILDILNANYHCHVGFIHQDVPVVIPTAYGNDDDFIYLHGSMASRMMKNLQTGIQVSICITEVNALVLAKSAFHHSMNYRSVVLFGNAQYVSDKDEKIKGLDLIVNHIVPGRSEEVRPMTAGELKGTMLLKLKIDQSSAKIRDEGANDDPADAELPIWTGIILIHNTYGEAIPETDLYPTPSSVLNKLKKKN